MGALKAAAGWIRWKHVGPAALLVAGLAAFCLVFLDPLVERAIEKAGTTLAGAKVEVRSVDVSWTATRVSVYGVEVADRGDPWTNLFQFDRASFDYALEPLLARKLLVQEMAVEGLRWGTRRKSSGEVRAKRGPSAFKRLAEKVVLPKFDGKGLRDLDWEGMADPDRLAGVKAVADSKKKAEEAGRRWERSIDELDVQSSLRQVRSTVEAAQSFRFGGAQDVAKAKQLLADLKKSQESLKEKLGQAQAIEQGVLRDLAEARSALAASADAEKRDVQGILERLKLPDFSAAGLARSLFGPVWLDRLDKAKFWIDKARETMPSRQDLQKMKEEPKPRREGVTVTYPGMKGWPKLLVEAVHVSGSSAKEENDPAAIDFSGRILGVTSDPALYGKPMTVDLKGARGPLNVSIEGLLDHRFDESKDEFRLSARGIDLAGKAWELPEYLPSRTESGSAAIEFSFAMRGPALKASLSAHARGLKLSAAKPAGGDLERALQKAFSGINALSVSAGAQGSEETPEFFVRTDLDELLAGQAKSVVGEEIGRLRGRIESRVHEAVAVRRREAAAVLEETQKETLGKLLQKSALLKDQQGRVADLAVKIQKQAVGEGIRSGIPEGFKGIFKKR